MRAIVHAAYTAFIGRPALKTFAYRRLVAVLAVLVVVLGLGGDCRAGIGDRLILNDSQTAFDAGPFAAMTPDPSGRMGYNDFVAGYNRGERGDRAAGPVLNFGAQGVAQWIVLTVDNKSWTDNWVLSFGQRMDGRMGLLQGIQIYDGGRNLKYIDTIAAAQNPYLAGDRTDGLAVKINLPRSGKTVLIIHAVPMAGHAVTLTPRFMTESNYIASMESPFRAERVVPWFLLVVTGFFIAAWIFGHLRGGWLFVGYYVLQALLYVHNSATLYNQQTYPGEIQEALFGAVFIIGLYMTRRFLDMTDLDRMQDRIVFGFTIALLLAVLGSVVVLPTSSAARQVGLFLPVLGALAYMTLLSAAQSYNGKCGSIQFAVGWGVLSVGLLASASATIGILPAAPVFVAAYWYALMAQAVLFITAVSTKILAVESEYLMAQAEKDESAEKLAALRQNREAAENSRLRRLIEHERDVMNRMREREMQRTEDMRKAVAGADEANRAKSAFLAVISHEIRTPMSGIMGMVRLLLESKLNKEQYDYAQTIQDSGDAMLALLNDILDFEKIESGKLDLEHIDFDLHRLIHGVITLMSGHASAKGLTLRANMDPDLPRYVIGDPVRLRQVLLNLTGNSIKFTKNGGVTLHVKIDPTADTKGASIHRIRFAVEDTGIGISKEAQKNLFNPFSQADASVTRKFGGTGLGLAISQRLIEAMGGRIHIDSTEGSGSTFFFTLIVEGGTAEGVEGQKTDLSHAVPEKVLKILVVEDNEINQKLMKEYLQRFGHETTLAGMGEDALAVLEKTAFDLILMDIELPGLSGMGVTKAIRAMPDRAKAATPVIALTGKTRDEDIGMAYAANMNGHLSKPVDPKRLRQAIDKVMQGKLDNPVQLPTEPAFAAKRTTVVQPPQTPPQNNEAGFTHRTLSPEDDPDAALLVQQYGPAPGVQAVKDDREKIDSSVFDDSMLAPLKGAMAEHDLQEMIDGLLAKLDEIVAVMAGDGANDSKTLTACAHDLKGMAGNFGLMELSHMATALEEGLHDADTESVRALLVQVADANARARGAIQEWLDR